MKKLLFCIALLFAGVLSAPAQVAKAPLQDLSGITASIMSKLSSNLSLTEVQKPKINTAVTNFLNQKAEIAPLEETNANAYTKKFNSMQHGLLGRFKAILTADQLTQFLALKPPSKDVTNVLSRLFY